VVAAVALTGAAVAAGASGAVAHTLSGPAAAAPAGPAALGLGARLTGSLQVTTRAARTAGWRMAIVRHYGSAHNASGYSAVVAPGRGGAWVFGGTNPGGTSAPVALQWTGSQWRSWKLPRGLTGFISNASASSPRDIWAVSYAGGYVLHWNGRAWSVATRWPGHGTLTGVTALSPHDVWVFGTTAAGMRGMGAWHFNGHSWRRVSGPAQLIYRASALSRNNIWAVAATRKGGLVEHYDGHSWRQVRTGKALGQARLDDVLALSRRSIWVVGNLAGHRDRRLHGDGRLVLAHFDGRHWTRVTTRWRADTGRLAAAGHGGVWVTADNSGARNDALIGHVCLRCTPSWATVRWGQGSGISDIAVSARTGTVWITGGFLTQAGGDAAVWWHQHRPRLADGDQIRIGGPLAFRADHL
jgi:hypothetical protein